LDGQGVLRARSSRAGRWSAPVSRFRRPQHAADRRSLAAPLRLCTRGMGKPGASEPRIVREHPARQQQQLHPCVVRDRFRTVCMPLPAAAAWGGRSAFRERVGVHGAGGVREPLQGRSGLQLLLAWLVARSSDLPALQRLRQSGSGVWSFGVSLCPASCGYLSGLQPRGMLGNQAAAHVAH